MIAKREKLQYGYLFLTDLISLAISAALVWFVFDGIFNKMIDFRSPDQVIEACFLLGVSYILTFFTFDQSENIITRTKTKEVEIAVHFNLLLALLDVACLALTKAPMLASRYFLLAIPLVNCFMMVLSHVVLKKLLTRADAKGFRSLVGVITTRDDAEAMLEDLKKDWSKQVTGIALLEVGKADIGDSIDGVEIKANYDNFMDWLRQEALDEVYMDIPTESGNTLLPYLKEIESMGLTVHFR